MKKKLRVSVKPLKGASQDSSEEDNFIGHLRMLRIHRPKFADTLRFPEDVTQLSSANVSELLGKYTLLLAYAAQAMSELNQASLVHEARASNRRVEIMRETPKMNYLEKHKREAFYESDAVLRDIERQRLHTNLRKEHTGMFMANFDRFITALSRELTRRSMVENREQRFSSR